MATPAEEQTLNRMLNELINIRELSARPAVLNQMAEFKVAAERDRASLNAQMNAALTRERGRQAGVGIGETVGGVFGKRAADIGGAVGGAVGGAAGTGFSALATTAAAITGPVGAIAGAVTAVTSAVGSFVQKANPGAMERLNLAFDDVSAVIGQTLTPVIETLTPAIRLFGDFLISILPSANEMAEYLAPVNELLADMRNVLADIAPVIKDVLSVALKAVGALFKALIWPLQQWYKFLHAVFGGGEQHELNTSVGAAAKNLSFVSAEQFSKNVNIAAFRTGQGDTGKTGVERTNELLEGISGFVKDIRGLMPNFKEPEKPAAKVAVGAASTFVPGFPSQTGKLFDIAQQIEAQQIEKRRRDMGPLIAATQKATGELARNLPVPSLPRWLAPALGINAAPMAGGGEAGEEDDELKRHIDQAKRRALDGHPGGA